MYVPMGSRACEAYKILQCKNEQEVFCLFSVSEKTHEKKTNQKILDWNYHNRTNYHDQNSNLRRGLISYTLVLYLSGT